MMPKIKPEKIDDRLKRYFEFQEIRALEPSDGEPGAVIEGLAIPYEVTTNVGGWFEEIIKRGALDGADLKDVPLFIHHQGQKIPLARSRNNNANSTMQLTVDDAGLHFRAKLDTENNSEARALYSAIQRQDVTGMSFSFSVKEEKWLNLDSDLPTREIYKYKKIYEISALWSPQYEETNIMARDEALDSADQLALESARSRELESSNGQQVEILKFKTQILMKG
jgi:HK97 family phage prohead protease